MDEIELIKQRMHQKRHARTNTFNYEQKTQSTTQNKYINFLITRILIAVILFFGVIILANASAKCKDFIEQDILKDNMSFTKISNIYNKYFGSIIPLKNVGSDASTVFNENITYEGLVAMAKSMEMDIWKVV